jgi:hypothetical protein
MLKSRNSILALILFIFAGLFTVYAIWTFATYNDEISNAITEGSLVFKGNEYQVINYYVAACEKYVFYALILTAVGFFLLGKPNISDSETLDESYKDGVQKLIETEEDIRDTDAILDDWLEKQKATKEDAIISSENTEKSEKSEKSEENDENESDDLMKPPSI